MTHGKHPGPVFFLWLSWCLRPLEGVPANAVPAPAKWTSKVGNFLWRWQWTWVITLPTQNTALLIGNPSNMIDHTFASSLIPPKNLAIFQWFVVKFGNIHSWKTKHRTMKNPWFGWWSFPFGSGAYFQWFYEFQGRWTYVEYHPRPWKYDDRGPWNQSPSSFYCSQVEWEIKSWKESWQMYDQGIS